MFHLIFLNDQRVRAIQMTDERLGEIVDRWDKGVPIGCKALGSLETFAEELGAAKRDVEDLANAVKILRVELREIDSFLRSEMPWAPKRSTLLEKIKLLARRR